MEEKTLEPQPAGTPRQPAPQPEPAIQKPWLKTVSLSILGLIFACGLVFAGYKLGKKQAQPVPTLIPTPVSKSTSMPKASPTPLPTLTSELISLSFYCLKEIKPDDKTPY